jgi:nicotinate-nucleotide adenylyltransferase
MKIVILGGSFNPVHLGHLIMAESVRAQFGYDRVLLVPASLPPHKAMRGDPGPEHRLAMLRLAVGDDPTMTVDDCEIRRGGPSYTVDTLRDVIARYHPDGKPGLIVGEDLADGLFTWRDPEVILELADIICARRYAAPRVSGAAVDSVHYPHAGADNPIIEISSSIVRDRISSGRAFRRFLDPGVYAYIVENRLYGYER